MARFPARQTLALAALLAGCSDAPTEPALRPDSPMHSRGSAATVSTETALRAALDAPLPGGGVRVVRLGADIQLGSTLTYGGREALRIEGLDHALTGPAAGSALVVASAADLALRDLTIAGALGHGVHMEIPAAATGTVNIELDGVTLRGNGLAGLWVDDQVNESAAGLRVTIRDSRVAGNGFRPGAEFADFDGVRVNEGGAGDLELAMHGTTVVGNAADGVELDETGDGDVLSRVLRTVFDDNGDQPQNPDDLEDGFDIDEAGAGSIRADFEHVRAASSEDEGIDLDEEGTGGVLVGMSHVEAVESLDANISITEDEVERAGGDVEIRLANVTASLSRDGDGVNIEEFGAGDVRGRIVHSVVVENADDGLQVEQNGGGTGLLRLQSVRAAPNGDDSVNVEGVTVVTVGRT